MVSDTSAEVHAIYPEGVASPHDLAARGFALTRPNPNAKNPTDKGWSTHGWPAEAFASGDLIGLLCGPLSDGGHPGHALVAVDLDCADAIVRADHYLPPTGMLEGKPDKPNDHRYFLTPFETIPEWAQSGADQGSAAAREQRGHPGLFIKHLKHVVTGDPLIDFLGTGGQIVCPSPSNARRWTGGQPGEPAVVDFLNLWNCVCRLLGVCGGNVPLLGPAATNGADPFTRAMRYVARMPPSISGRGGHDALWDATLATRGFGLGREQARQVLDTFNQRCDPPWSDGEIEHKLDDRENAHVPAGYLLRGQRGARAAPPPPAESNGHVEPGDAHSIILAWLRHRYVPVFREGDAFFSEKLGRLVRRNEAVSAPDNVIIGLLTKATNAPRSKRGELNFNGLPNLFATWSRVAVGTLLGDLPIERRATEESPVAKVIFWDRMVLGLRHFVSIGTTEYHGQTEVTRTERRPIHVFALKELKARWKRVHDYSIWGRIDARGVIQSAVNSKLFTEIKYAPLAGMRHEAFATLCERYGIGTRSRNRAKKTVILSDEFFNDLDVTLTVADTDTPAQSATDGAEQVAMDTQEQSATVEQEQSATAEPEQQPSPEDGMT
jgi:hypothetical protein